MNDINPSSYCSKKPKFPHKLFTVSLIVGPDYEAIAVPFSQAYLSIEELTTDAITLVEESCIKYASVLDRPKVIVASLKFKELVPLKREYWEGEHENFSTEDKGKLFLQFYRNPDFFQILVNPRDYDPKSDTFELDATLPVKINANEETIEQFMQNSDYPVNELASHSALYEPMDLMYYNFDKKCLEKAKKADTANKFAN